MAMDGVDYTQRYWDVRNRYDDATKDLKENYQQDLENLQEVHDNQRKSQAESYLNDKLRMEEDNTENIAKRAKETKEALDRKQEDYQKRLMAERDYFDETRKKTTIDLTNKLNDAKDAFSRLDRENRERYEYDIANKKENYDKNLKDSRNFFEETINDTKSQARNSSKDYKMAQDQEKRELRHTMQNDKLDMMKEYAKEDGVKTASHRDSINKLRDSYEGQLDKQRENFNNNTNSLKDMHARQENEMTNSYRKNVDDIERKNIEVETNTNRRYKEDVENRERRFANEVESLNRKAVALSKLGGTSDESANNLERVKNSYENRQKNFQNYMDNILYDKKVAQEKAQDEFRNTIVESEDNQKERELNLIRDNNLSVKNLARKFTNERDNLVSQYDKELKSTVSQNEARSLANREMGKQQLEGQRKIFGDTIRRITDDKNNAISNIQGDFAKEKTAYLERAKKDQHKEMSELKDNMNDAFTRKALSYETQILDQNNQKELLKSKFEKYVDTMQTKTSKEIEETQLMAKENREADMKASKKIMSAREDEYMRKFLSLKGQFDKKISEIKHENEILVEKLTQRYEDRIEQMSKENKKEYKLLEDGSRERYEKMVRLNEINVNALRDQYELKIDKLRQANREALEIDSKRKS